MNFSETTKNFVKATIKKTYMEQWYNDMYDLDKYPILRTYNLFKKDFTMSKHLICVKNAKHSELLLVKLDVVHIC